MSTLMNLQIVWNSYDSQLKNFKSSPMIARDLKEIRENASKIKNIDDFINNRQVFNFVLKAYGMDDKPYPAYIKKLLVEGTKDPKAFANSFVDSRIKEFVNDMGFADGKNGNFGNADFMAKLVQKYEVLSFEEEKGKADGNVRLGLYFERKASSMKDWYSVLADKAMSEVVITALGLPPEARLGDIDKLADLLEKRIPIKDFQDPKKVKSIVQRFAVLGDRDNAIASNPTIQLFQGQLRGRQVVHIDPSVLAMANKMRYQ